MKRYWTGSKIWVLGTLVALILLTTACGGGSSEGGSGDKVTLKIMHPWTSPNVDNQVYKARIAEFEKQHPNIEIKQDEVPAEQYKTKLRTLAAANNLADINVVWPGVDLQPLVTGNLLMPIDDQMDNWKSLLREDALAGFNQNGHQYAIPTKQTFVDIIYYNKKMLADVGYSEFPKTYAQFTDAVKKLKAAGITPMALGNKGKWPLQSTYLSIIGDRFTGSDFLNQVLEKKATFTDPNYVKAIGVIADLSNMGAFNTDANNMDSVQAQDYLIQGKAAMHMSSSTVDGRVRMTNEQGDQFGIALFPSMKDEGGTGDPAVSAGVAQYGIALKNDLDEQQKAAAQEFMKFFLSKELYTQLVSEGILVPANVDIPDDASPYMKEMIKLTSNGTAPVFDGVVPLQVTDVVQNGLQALTLGQGTPEQVAQETQAAYDNMK
ncbi:extracellular solute-binding protein [Paenibacillus kandeliae]|uniref:extracellular solute-binding protein n=1 Tax=Paenibacillus kandeliae TaxID=3231269 RepID=UPI00345909FC